MIKDRILREMVENVNQDGLCDDCGTLCDARQRGLALSLVIPDGKGGLVAQRLFLGHPHLLDLCLG